MLIRAALVLLGIVMQVAAFDALAQAASQERRVALVIGNSRYADAPLRNAVADAQDIAAVLRAAGFQVMLREDVNLRAMTEAVRAFGDSLRADSVAVFYYAGHGVQVRDRNYLIPVGADIRREDEIPYAALDVNQVLDKLERADSRVNIVILDACRNNPFARAFRSPSQGLAQMDAPVGTLIAYATAPGRLAIDDDGGRNGIYARHLLPNIRVRNLPVELMFKRVREGVIRESKSMQTPWESSSLRGDFTFFDGPPAPSLAASEAERLPGGVAIAQPSAPLLESRMSVDDALWSALKDSSNPAEVAIYLNRFPSGRHADDARARLGELLGSGKPPSASAKPSVEEELDTIDQKHKQELQRLGEDVLKESTARINDIVKWGDENTDRRPAKPKSTGTGFAEGDRYRYRTLDRVKDRYVDAGRFYRVDRIDQGQVWLNDGAVVLDLKGQLLSTGGAAWERWDPPLPLLEMRDGARGMRRTVETAYSARSSTGVAIKVAFSGSATTGEMEKVSTPAGEFVARRVEVSLTGRVNRSDGLTPFLSWRRTYWYAPNIGMPVVWRTEDRSDSFLEERLHHELTAYDVLSARPALAGGTNQ